MIGQTVSHYKILEKLGEGGMGVVYKARDTMLDRVVALKFLPHYLTSDPTEKERFYHEARAASALLHTNVAVVFEINEHDGQLFIAMEYVEGKTLSEIVQAETLAIKKVLDIAIQVCDGLAAAHERGIVHRDIKSENIMVTAKGQPKITDFGLAKMKGATKLTKTGSTLGTAAYMSPEQARGEDVDHRSDIFSFGIVLYEMLTGKLPFRGEHHAALLYSIIHDEPKPIARFNEKATPEIERIVAKALEKDRDDRYQHADEILSDLRRERKKLDYVRTTDVAEPAAIKAKSSKRKIWFGIGAVAVLAAVGVTYLLVSKHPSRPTLNPNMTFRVLPIPFTEAGAPGLSHDGNWAAFPAADASGRWDIYYMNTISGESRCMSSDSSLYMQDADISPDGSQIVYDRANPSTMSPEIAIVSCVGGSSKKVVDNGVDPRWRPDGQRVGYVREKGYGSQSGKAEFWTIKPNGSDNRCELVDSVSSQTRSFSWSPDGQSICWIRYVSEQCQEVMVYELSTGKARQVTFDKKEITNVCWAPNDQIIFASKRSGNFNLWMVPASGGTATQITKGAGPDHSMEISRDGTKLLYCQRQFLGHIWIAGTDGSNPHQITFDDAFLWRVNFSPDGKKVLFGLALPIGSTEGSLVCSIDRDGSNRRQLTSGEETINNPLQSPDGRWIMYGRHALADPVDSSRVYLIDAENPGAPRRVGKGVPIRWIGEKTFISNDLAAHTNWLNSIDGGEPQKFFEDSTWAIPLQGGKYVGYYDERSGRQGWWVGAAPGSSDPNLSSPRRLVSSGEYGEFDKSGKFLYWVKNAEELRRISIPAGKEEIIRGTFPGLSPPFFVFYFDISYDGKEIVYTDARVNSKLVMIENLFK
jgi:serine/threonine protein kinase/dipeptidyl aminopeptidase/acylaminoacyl peptidase